MLDVYFTNSVLLLEEMHQNIGYKNYNTQRKHIVNKIKLCMLIYAFLFSILDTYHKCKMIICLSPLVTLF